MAYLTDALFEKTRLIVNALTKSSKISPSLKENPSVFHPFEYNTKRVTYSPRCEVLPKKIGKKRSYR